MLSPAVKRQRRTEAFAKGLCTNCLRRPVVSKSKRCEICREKLKKYNPNSERAKRKECLSLGICTYCKCKKVVEGHRHCQLCIENNKKKCKNKHLKLKTEVFEAYGNGKCQCCGESNIGFLTIDHIYNDGTRHKKSIGKIRKSFYFYLKENGFPDKDRLRVLCYNCNMGRDKAHDKICPHKKIEKEQFEDGAGI